MKLKGYLKNRAKENKGIFKIPKEYYNINEDESNLLRDFPIFDYYKYN